MLLAVLLLLAIALFFRDNAPSRPYYVIVIGCCATLAVLFPPPFSDFVKYANAFLSSAYVIRAVELLLVYNPSHLQRLGRVTDATYDTSSSPPQYVWNPFLFTLGYRRLRWIGDLLVNPRAIGWSHGPARYRPPEDQSSSHAAFTTRQIYRLLVGYLILDTYQAVFGRNFPVVSDILATVVHRLLRISISPPVRQRLVQKYIFGPACGLTSYAFVDGIHAAFSLLGVSLPSVISPGLGAEPWMYPQLFGSVRYLFTFRLREIWGKMWHDLCRRPFLAISLSVIPKSAPVKFKRLIVLYTSFILSGVIHASGAYAVSQNLHAAVMTMVFFLVLPTCISLQQAVSGEILPRLLPRNALSRVVVGILDVAFLWFWATLTCPWFIEYSMLPQAMASIPIPFSLWGWLGRCSFVAGFAP
ncbi:hypothetical protein EYZ11_007488 [Aspergillus tanneri]|nr:hypothetical protein EYZ11_007488 [Aspergillus tanneri]